MALAGLTALLLPTSVALAQCPMCRTALANSPEGQQMADGFNHGILFLLGAPFLVIGVMTFLIVKTHPEISFRREAPKDVVGTGFRRARAREKGNPSPT